jgi:large subunit ribosomal protein L21|tara:strand:- start:185 stop:529 length:345 start_codon:yes stop_codon:yes gene_type:complete
MDYAIIKTGGKQYRVREGDSLTVEKLEGNSGDSILFEDVLMTSLKGKINIGEPTVEGAVVKAKIEEQAKAKKVISLRYKNKTRHRVKTGHRQQITNVVIESISIKKARSKASGT